MMGNLSKGFGLVCSLLSSHRLRCVVAFASALLLAVSVASAQSFDSFGGGGFGDGLGGLGFENAEPVTVSAQFTPANADRPAVLMVTADLQPGWHIYSLTQPKGGPQRTQVLLADSDQFKLAGSFASFPEPHSFIDQEAFIGVEVQEHTSQVTWYVPIEITPSVSPASIAISGTVKLQACNKSCIPMSLPFVAKVGQGVPIGPLNMAPPPIADAEPVAPKGNTPKLIAPLTTGESYDLNAIQFEESGVDGGSLAWYLGIAFLGGLALNLMPCVLPVIGLKVMSFVEQAGHSRAQAFALNAWYSLGILSVFLILAGLAIGAGLSWGEQFSSEAFNVVMASIIFVMALSLLGVWEIPIPGFIGSGKAQQAASQEGAIGAFLKGVVTTLLATPCIGPGMGAALGWAVKQPPAATLAVFTSLGIGMASPYLLIGIFPGLVRFLPKPGEWMETFKQLMGFVLLGTVLFLLAILPSYDLLPTLALFTCLALACWTYAKTPLTATAGERQQTWALSGAITVGGAVFAFGYLAPLLQEKGDAAWQPFSLATLKQVAVDDRKTVLVDFSASWCANCKVLERTVLHTKRVEEAIQRHGVITMYADNTDYPPEIESTLHALRANGVPVIAIFPGGDPYRPIVFRDGYTQSGLVNAIEQATNARAELASLPAGF